jgi:phage terminase large subunit-like protein
MKEVRIRGLVPRYSVGKIYHIESPDLEKELLAFPKGANDDVADAEAYLPQIVKYPKPLIPYRGIRTKQNNAV